MAEPDEGNFRGANDSGRGEPDEGGTPDVADNNAPEAAGGESGASEGSDEAAAKKPRPRKASSASTR